jgi:hypothetical protein
VQGSATGGAMVNGAKAVAADNAVIHAIGSLLMLT